MARKSSAAPFKMKYTNGKKTDSTAFFQMANPPAAPNPAVDEAIKKQMDQKIAQKVDQAVTPEESSPALQTKQWTPPKSGGYLGEDKKKKEKSPAEQKAAAKKIDRKKTGKMLKKVGQVAATSLTHGLDAVYGTGKIAANPSIFDKDKDKEKNSNEDGDFDPTT